jgi:hypothetical protein
MKTYRFDGPARLLGAALMASPLLSTSSAGGEVTALSRTEDKEPPLPSRKSGDEDPPLPSKKPVPAKEVRVQVPAPSAEVQAGDKVVATVRRGEVLPFTKKTEDYYLVVVDGKKGWRKREAAREVEVPVRGPDAPATEVPPGPAPAVIDKDTAGKAKRATIYLRVRLANGNTVEGSGFFAVQPGFVLTNAHVLGMLSPGSPMPCQRLLAADLQGEGQQVPGSPAGQGQVGGDGRQGGGQGGEKGTVGGQGASFRGPGVGDPEGLSPLPTWSGFPGRRYARRALFPAAPGKSGGAGERTDSRPWPGRNEQSGPRTFVLGRSVSLAWFMALP